MGLRPGWDTSMRNRPHTAALSVRAALVSIGVLAATGNASTAPTAEVAKKCAALTAKAFPPRVAGNPAAGSAKGSAQSERSYFNKCLENAGNMEEPAAGEDVPIPPERPR
jgi:hypothetical protein